MGDLAMQAIRRLMIAAVVFLGHLQSSCTGTESTRDALKVVNEGVVKVIVSDEMGNDIGTGTGFFLDDSTVATCYHALTLVEGVKSARIVTPQQKTYTVKGVTASDRAFDILLLALDRPASDAQPLVLAKMPPKNGDPVFVLGFPEARDKQNVLRTRVTYVAHVYRTGIQIAVPDLMRPGQSGSPGVNSAGEVTGLVTSGYVSNEGLAPGVPLGFLTSTTSIRGMKREKAVPLSSFQANGIEVAVQKEQVAVLDYTLHGRRKTTRPRFEVAARYAGESLFALKVYSRVGMAYFANGRYAEAMEVAKEVTRFMPDDGASQALLGACYMYQGRSKEAIDSFQNAIRIMPDCVTGYFLLGTAYVLAGDKDLALKEYKKVAEIDKDVARRLKNIIDKMDTKPSTNGKELVWKRIVAEGRIFTREDLKRFLTVYSMSTTAFGASDIKLAANVGETAGVKASKLVDLYGQPDRIVTEGDKLVYLYGPLGVGVEPKSKQVVLLFVPKSLGPEFKALLQKALKDRLWGEKTQPNNRR